ncbi:hypothetical protein N7474_004676 [Penicillium riverlandense]|uniref:uncharacterized protein n=1 Tax=Penicillium riverlandense TaxID=1903569 RepID=UPI002547F544|nr:uncharacterized protein N7474_004676 [Penicillium riverlandense]KAJ5819085.1 hypothetical protein N7474_004676 [Penicillium riverlandense]
MDSSIGAGVPIHLFLSEDGLYGAHVSGKDLVIHSSPASTEAREVQIARLKESPPKLIKYSPTSKIFSTDEGWSTSEQRLLTANDARISVWQPHPLQIFADIESIEPGSLNVEFGGDGNEIIVFHAWHTKLSIHFLDTGRTSMIKTPKFSHPLGFGYRPQTRQLAILLKPEASDVLTVHEYRSYDLINRAVLSTIDAQGLKWSPDGRWIAVWDVASAGTKVLVFTADGQLYRTYTGPGEVDESFDLGVKQIEWSPAVGQNDTCDTLAVGKVNGHVDLLRTRTFTSATTLSHVFQVDANAPTIWRERYINADGDAEYIEASSSSAFSMSPESSGPPRGVSIMAFSPDGSLLATVDSMRSNVLWIWSLDGTPRLASALIHEQPVRQAVWHPSTAQLLINTIMTNLPTVRWWSPGHQPVIARVPTRRNESGRYDVKWLVGSEEEAVFWFGSTEEYVVGYLSAEDGPVQFDVLNRVLNTPSGSSSLMR